MIRRAAFLLLFLSSFTHAGETPLDPIWPKLVQSEQGSLLIYQPQIDSYEKGNLVAHAALALTTDTQRGEVFGSIKFTAQTKVDTTAKTVLIERGAIEKIDFPDNASKSIVERLVSRQILGGQAILPLGRFEAALQRAEIQASDETPVTVNTEPPDIYVRTRPAFLVLVEGTPRLSGEENKSVLRVTNTPEDVFLDTESRQYFVKAGSQWFQSRTVTGHWVRAKKVPSSILGLKSLARKEQTASSDKASSEIFSEVIVSTVPAALIQLDGSKELSPLGDSGLLYVVNTDSDVLFDIASQKYYFLYSGRWLSSSALESHAKWRFVDPEKLPDAFAHLDEEIKAPDVLASVPGTPEAQQSVAKASIPQTAQIDRAQASLDVKYAGDPEFDKIDGTPLDYAINTSSAVIRFRGMYYAVQDGVWFVAQTSRGPWSVATYVPQEIYAIPPSHPLHNVTYVYIYDSTPRYVYTGYMPGYTGSYAYHNTVVYGTGYDYYSSYYQSYRPYYWRPARYYAPVIPGFSLYFNFFFNNRHAHNTYNNYYYDDDDDYRAGYGPRRRHDHYKKERHHRRRHNLSVNNAYGVWRDQDVVDRRDRRQRSEQFQQRMNRPQSQMRQIPGTADMTNRLRRPQNRGPNQNQLLNAKMPNLSNLTNRQRQALEAFHKQRTQTQPRKKVRQTPQAPKRLASQMPRQLTKQQRQALEAFQRNRTQKPVVNNKRQIPQQQTRPQNQVIMDAMNRARQTQNIQSKKRQPGQTVPQMTPAQRRALEAYQRQRTQTPPTRQVRQTPQTRKPPMRRAPRQLTRQQQQALEAYQRQRTQTPPTRQAQPKRNVRQTPQTRKPPVRQTPRQLTRQQQLALEAYQKQRTQTPPTRQVRPTPQTRKPPVRQAPRQLTRQQQQALEAYQRQRTQTPPTRQAQPKRNVRQTPQTPRRSAYQAPRQLTQAQRQAFQKFQTNRNKNPGKNRHKRK